MFADAAHGCNVRSSVAQMSQPTCQKDRRSDSAPCHDPHPPRQTPFTRTHNSADQDIQDVRGERVAEARLEGEGAQTMLLFLRLGG